MDENSKTFKGLQRLKSLGFMPDAILDIGAHNGEWTRGIRKIFPDAYVLMIDALEEKQAVLEYTSVDVRNADYRIALLGPEDVRATHFYVVDAGGITTGSSRFRENTRHPINDRIVPQTSLSTLLDHMPQQNFDLIKLDIQGGELDALSGGARHLSSVQVILMEVAVLPYNAGAPMIREVIGKMHDHGFALFDVLDDIRLPNGCLFQFDAMFIRPDASFRPRPPY